MENEPLYEESALIAMMKSVINGGAKGLRLAGERDIKNAKKLFNVPIIGLILKIALLLINILLKQK